MIRDKFNRDAKLFPVRTLYLKEYLVVNQISKIRVLSPAQRGAAFLDEHFPAWAEPGRINLETFTVKSTLNCILGQLYGNVENGLNALGLGLCRDSMSRYGFAPSTIGGLEKNIQKLNDDWLVEINRRMLGSTCEALAYY